MKIFYLIAYVYHRFFRLIYRRKRSYQSMDFERHHHKMKHYKGLLLIVGIVLFLYVKPTTADFMSGEDKTVAVADILDQSTVKVTDDIGTGTAFFIAQDELITNEHVVKGLTTVFITKKSGSMCIANVVKTDKVKDLALLKSYCDGIPLKLAQSVKVGQSLVLMGNPISQSFFLSKGIVSNLLDDYVLTDAFIDHGSSGSPMVDLNGEVVGVVVGVYHDTNIGAGRDVQALNQFMKES